MPFLKVEERFVLDLENVVLPFIERLAQQILVLLLFEHELVVPGLLQDFVLQALFQALVEN